MTDHAHKERERFIFTRSHGIAAYRIRKWHDYAKENCLYALLILLCLYLLAGYLDYRDQAMISGAENVELKQKLAIAEQYKRSEPVIFVLPANDLDEYELGLRRVLNAANDGIIHAKAAGGK